MLVGPDESYRLDKRFSCTVNCETEKDRLWEFGGVGDGDGGVAGGLLVEMARGVRGGCLFAGTEFLHLVKAWFQFCFAPFS